MFEINTDFLMSQQIINVFTQETLYLSFICKRNLCFPCQKFLEASMFYHIFRNFDSGWGVYFK